MYSVDVSVPFYRDNSKRSGYIADEYLSVVGGEARHEFLLGQALPHIIGKFADGFDMVVLDTMHILPGELLDYLAILPRLAPGAVICLHDISLNQQYIFPFERIGQGSRVVLYGAGNVGRSYYRQIKDYAGIKLVGWVDAARREAYEGCSISSPDTLPEWGYDYVVIAVWPEDVAKQIHGSLLSAGVAEEKIIWVQQG